MLSLTQLDFDGSAFHRRAVSVKIASFQGAKKILALPCYPFDMIPDRDKIKRRLVARGKQFRQLNIRDVREQRLHHTGWLETSSRFEEVRTAIRMETIRSEEVRTSIRKAI